MNIGFAGLLAVVFIAMKVAGVIAWPWLWVLAPLWISAILLFLGFLLFLLIQARG